MSDFVRHVDHAACVCTTCLLVNHCGIPADDRMWAEIELASEARAIVYDLTHCFPPLCPKPGPWAGERPWFALWGLALDFGDDEP